MTKIGCQRIDCKYINDDCICQCEKLILLQVDKEGKLKCNHYEQDKEWLKLVKDYWSPRYTTVLSMETDEERKELLEKINKSRGRRIDTKEELEDKAKAFDILQKCLRIDKFYYACDPKCKFYAQMPLNKSLTEKQYQLFQKLGIKNKK